MRLSLKTIPVFATAVGLSLFLGACNSAEEASPTATQSASAAATSTDSGASASADVTATPVDDGSAESADASSSASLSPEEALASGDMSAELLDPVALDESVDLGEVTVAVTQIEEIEGEAYLPGEEAGPAVAITVSVTNDADEEVSLSGMVVDLQDADGSPYPQLTVGSTSVPAEVTPGDTITGTWVFTIPVAERETAQILVDLGADTNTAVLQGDLSSM